MATLDAFDEQYERVSSLLQEYMWSTSQYLSGLHSSAGSWWEPDERVILDIPEVNIGSINLPQVGSAPDIVFPSLVQLNAPPAPDLSVTLENIPAMPNFGDVDIPDVPSIQIPEWAVPDVPVKPTLAIPDAPTVALPTEPTLVDLDIPSLPSLTFPDPPSYDIPSLEEMGLQSAPDINNFTSELNAILDDLDNLVPSVSDEEFAELKAELKRRGIDLDSPVMPSNVLDELINSYREKYDKLIQDKTEELLALWSSRGFTMPVGLAARQAKDVMEEATTKRWDNERELLFKVFDATREDTKFYVQQHRELLQFILDANLKVKDMMIQARTALYELAVKVFSVKADVYRTIVEATRSKIELYNSIIQAERSKLEVYLGQIQAEKLKGELNQQQVEVYRARLSGVETLYSIYSRQIEAQNTLVSMYRTEIESFASLVQAYMLKFKIPELQLNIYRAQVEGKTAQLRAIEEKINAWKTQVDGLVSKNEASLTELRTKSEAYAAEVQAFRAQVDAQRALVSMTAEDARAQTEIYSAKIAQYRATTEALVAESQTQQAYLKLKLDSVVAKAKLVESRYEFNQQTLIQDSAIKERALEASARISGTVMSAALNSLTAVVQLVQSTITSA